MDLNSDQLLQNSLGQEVLGGYTLDAGECLCHHVVDPVHIKDPPSSLVHAGCCELVLSTGRVGADHFDFPQSIRPPHQNRMRWGLVVEET